MISPEARDIVSKMITINPNERISAKDALEHRWFQIDHSGSNPLSSAQENMEKYSHKHRFNMEKIKPEFSMVMCTPLLNARANQHSPINTAGYPVAQSPLVQHSGLNKEDQIKKGGILMRNIYGKPQEPKKESTFGRQTKEEDNGDFNEEEIDENDFHEKNEKISMIKTVKQTLVPHVLGDRKTQSPNKELQKNNNNKNNAASYINSLATPIANRRVIKEKEEVKKKSSYFQTLKQSIPLSISNPVQKKEEEKNKKNTLMPNFEENPDEFHTAMSHPNIEDDTSEEKLPNKITPSKEKIPSPKTRNKE